MASESFVALAQHLSHDIRNHGRQVARQAVHLHIHSVELPLQPIDLLLHAVEPRLDCRQIVAVAAGLLEDMPCDELLALDLALENVELFSGHVSTHWCALADRGQRSTAFRRCNRSSTYRL